MADKRNRIVEYLKSLGIEVNVCKNKARGNKGFFRAKSGAYRMDIASGLSEDAILRVITHEFMHYIHYKYDEKLKSLNFIFGETDKNILEEELITLTVHSIPKSSIKLLFDVKSKLEEEINLYSKTNSFADKVLLNYKSKMLKSINSKISRLNRYYNSPGELLARAFELFLYEPNFVKNNAPIVYSEFSRITEENLIPELKEFIKILL